MKIQVNGAWREIPAGELTAVLEALGYADSVVSTAVNGEFVPVPERAHTVLAEGDRIEVLAPMQGG